MINAYCTSGSSPTTAHIHEPACAPSCPSANQTSAPILSPEQQRCLAACVDAGVVFQGIQAGCADIESVCLFARTDLSTTLCLPVSQVSAQAILDRLKLSETRKLIATA